MLSASSSLSLRTALDNVLTWTNLKPSKSSTQDRPLARNRDIFSVMVTPDRIPQFFIPSLEVDHIFVHVNPGDGGQPGCAQELQVTSGAKPSCASPEPCSSRREAVARREALCKKAFLPSTDGSLFTQDLERAADHSDPATRAALSLPHLAKITTPYGFLALGESPNIRRKESLFFEQDPQDIRSLLSHRKKSNSLSRSRSSPVGGSEQPPTGQQEPTLQPIRSSRSVSWDAICKATSSTPPTPSNSLSLTPCNKPEKTRFQSLIKKHLASIKRMRSGSSTGEKAPASFRRTRSQTVQ
ncbi:C2 calcium-dependent domain-containing protein 4C-like [Lepisosteus oculatus]|uniref:C2 calcium-dependent domain-containing protein 4C-like n=1 Tax=Lepisosteus oculatus TaxID=7918 RepID=UPI0035F51CB1